MPKVPLISGREAIRVFERLGWIAERQKGSHISMWKPDVPQILTVPDHKELGIGILRGLIRTAGVSVAEFVRAMKS